VQFAIGELAQTAACNRLHSMEERCCRWLMIAHDSARSDTFSLTHEFLAMMLGVQRAGVSITAASCNGPGTSGIRGAASQSPIDRGWKERPVSATPLHALNSTSYYDLPAITAGA